MERLALLFDPEILVLTGDLTASGDRGEKQLMKQYARILRERGLGDDPRMPPVAFSQLGQDAVAQGAAAMVLERIAHDTIRRRG